MANMLYRMSFEFRLTRLVPWTDDGTDFYGHVESVRAKIGTHELIEDARAITDISESLLNFDFLIEAPRHQMASAEAVRIVRDAIESCDARHFGMDPSFSGLFHSAGAHTSLGTPVWHRRSIHIDVAA